MNKLRRQEAEYLATRLGTRNDIVICQSTIGRVNSGIVGRSQSWNPPLLEDDGGK